MVEEPGFAPMIGKNAGGRANRGLTNRPNAQSAEPVVRARIRSVYAVPLTTTGGFRRGLTFLH